MRWLVGIDFNGHSGGALHMAAWMRSHARASHAQELVALHVLPERLRRLMVREATVDAPAITVDNLRRLVAEAGVGEPFAAFRAEWAESADEGLALAAASPDLTGIVIGRATGQDAGLARLGRVARRLLRRLPAPVMVVPPDLVGASIGKGPIVLGTDLEAHSVPAAETAGALAAALGRELVVVSVEETLRQVPALGPEAFIPLQTVERHTIDDLRAWTRARGLDSAQSLIRRGMRVSTLLEVAREHDAALIVCGSRRLTLEQRIFASSTASELARRAERAVLVVPARGIQQ